MKTLFALLWLSAMIWLAAPAHAHPDEGGGGGRRRLSCRTAKCRYHLFQPGPSHRIGQGGVLVSGRRRIVWTAANPAWNWFMM